MTFNENSTKAGWLLLRALQKPFKKRVCRDNTKFRDKIAYVGGPSFRRRPRPFGERRSCAPSTSATLISGNSSIIGKGKIPQCYSESRGGVKGRLQLFQKIICFGGGRLPLLVSHIDRFGSLWLNKLHCSWIQFGQAVIFKGIKILGFVVIHVW